MSKRRRKGGSRQGAAMLRNRGHQAFVRGDYDGAVEAWTKLQEQISDMLPDSALAEAYFRRGLARLYGKKPDKPAGLEDIRQAEALTPDDARYTYHRGLVAHRQGDLDTALRCYKKVHNAGGALAARAAFPLVLALKEQGEDPTAHPAWDNVLPESQAMLHQINAFDRRPYTLDDDAPVLWRALAAVDQGERELAQRLLDRALADAPTPLERGVVHYYAGVLAAQDEDWDAARRQWNQAAAAGFDAPYLIDNLGEAYHRMAETRLAEDDVEGALAAASEAARYTPDDNRLGILLSQVHQRLGYQAATAGRWAEALEHWNAAYESEGGSFRLAYNLALGYEKLEDFDTSAEYWREALRRRPRRDDHVDAITDEEVAKLWRHTAETYVKAGEYEEALHVYKLAVKWNPDSLDTRMALVEGYINDGRLQAAENELNRILEKNEDYIPALLRMGEVLAETEYWWYGSRATDYWERVLELEPQNSLAREALVDYYLDKAQRTMHWPFSDKTHDYLEKALSYQPDNPNILAQIGACYFDLGDPETGTEYLDRALAHDDVNMDAYAQIVRVWLVQENQERLDQVRAHMEAHDAEIAFEFYIFQILEALYTAQSMDYARPWLELAIAKAPPDVNVYVRLGDALIRSPAFEFVPQLMQPLLEGDDEEAQGHAYKFLAIVAVRQNDQDEARRCFQEAEHIARRHHDTALLEEVRMLRDMLEMPPGMINMLLNHFSETAGDMDPDSFIDDFIDEFYDDEEYDDDEDFFDFFGI